MAFTKPPAVSKKAIARAGRLRAGVDHPDRVPV